MTAEETTTTSSSWTNEHNSNENSTHSNNPSFMVALLSGGIAGMSVDIALYPIDTIKTRLQSSVGFWRSGGFRGIYNGLSATALGSAPGAALFFATYETMKTIYTTNDNNTTITEKRDGGGSSSGSATGAAVSHMMAASVGEAVACLIRVPTDVVKAKMQTAAAAAAAAASSSSSRAGSSSGVRLVETVRQVLQEKHGPMSNITGGLYRGYGITILREIPFAMIQFPLYERFKIVWSEQLKHSGGDDIGPMQSAICGSISGGVAAAITTPLDVIKTRLMIGTDGQGIPYRNAIDVFNKTIHQDGGGYRALFSGIQPRVIWISLGGFIFFGSYETSKSIMMTILPPSSS